MAVASSIATKQNLDICCLIWLDTSVNDNQQNLQAQQQLRTLINHLETFEYVDACETYIRSLSKENRIILIASGRLGQQIVPRIYQLRQISSIYIYCMDKEFNEQWSKQYSKVKGVVVQLDELINQIQWDQFQQQQHNKSTNDSPLIHTFDSKAGKSFTGINGQFIYSRILIDCLLQMNSSSTDKTELITFYKQHYKIDQNDMNNLQEFEDNYSSKQALRWYTKDSFIYLLLNKALRTQDVDLLFLFRFFIRDIEQELNQNKCSSQVRLYRGQSMANEEIEMIKNSLGQFISFNSFLSTSLNRHKAQSFLSSSSTNHLEQVIFEIDANPKLNNIRSFSDISSKSNFPLEEEILFMLGSIFRIINIRSDNNEIWIIHLRLCSENDHQLKSLFDYIKNEYGQGEKTLLSFGHILEDMGKFDDAEKYYRRLMRELPYDHFDLASCYHSLGNVVNESQLEWHYKSLEIKLKTLKLNHPNIANSYHSIANIYRRRGDYKRALESFEKALHIWKQAFGENDLYLAFCYNSIGLVYDEEKKYSKALEFYQKALNIRRFNLPDEHPHIAHSHNNIGAVYHCLENYDRALEHYKHSLEIKSKSLPSQHPTIIVTLENIGIAYEKKGDFHQALDSFKKAALIIRSSLPPSHSDAIQNEQNIQRVTFTLN